MGRYIIAVLFVYLLFGCATTSVRSSESGSSRLNDPIKFLEQKDEHRFRLSMNMLIESQGGYSKARELFAGNEAAKIAYLKSLSSEIQNPLYPMKASALSSKIRDLEANNVLSASEITSLRESLNKAVATGNLDGKIAYDLGDDTSEFPYLKSSPHIEIITDRTIKLLRENTAGNRPLSELMSLVSRSGSESELCKRVEKLLPSMNIKKRELDVVATVYPDYAKSRLAESSLKVNVQFRNADRLLVDDIKKVLLERLSFLKWVDVPDEKTLTVVVDKIRNDEKIIPERTQTITYSFSEVSFFNAVLLMPRNASYLFDLITAGAEIEYGYGVAASKGGKQFFDEVTRGRVGGEFSRCQNQRIQNVFGGISSANFIANDDMQSRCGYSKPVGIDGLRASVLGKVVDLVSVIPDVRAQRELSE